MRGLCLNVLRRLRTVAVVMFLTLVSACTVRINLEDDPRWNYVIAGPDLPAVVVVVPADLVERSFEFETSAAVGLDFISEYGKMFLQTLNIEIPQISSVYQISEGPSSNIPADAVIINLDVVDYQFSDFQARVGVDARASGPDGKVLLHRKYSSQGESWVTQARSTPVGTRFVLQAAVRNSTLDAYKKVLQKFRDDLDEKI